MNQYVTGAMIKKLRESKNITQAELANRLSISDKTISKWETGKGYPDITLVEPLAQSLEISVIELMSGSDVTNMNRSHNVNRMKFYVCPVCGNVITSIGDTVVSCCGVTLPALEAEDADQMHTLSVEKSEDEYYVTVNHDMSKSHYISFIAAVKDNSVEMTKLYPEGIAEARFKISRTKKIFFYCNRHGLYKQNVIMKKEK